MDSNAAQERFNYFNKAGKLPPEPKPKSDYGKLYLKGELVFGPALYSLCQHKKTEMRTVIDKIDRDFDCVRDLGMKFTGIVVQPNERYFLRFEHSTTLIPAYFGISELSSEDKIYLLDLIKKI